MPNDNYPTGYDPDDFESNDEHEEKLAKLEYLAQVAEDNLREREQDDRQS